MIQFSEKMQVMNDSCCQFRALCSPSGKEDVCFQMRLNYGPTAHFLMFFISWTDCRLAGTLGLLHILIYKVIYIIFIAFLALPSWYINATDKFFSLSSTIMFAKPSQVMKDGNTSMSVSERKASLREFYGNVLLLFFTFYCDALL